MNDLDWAVSPYTHIDRLLARIAELEAERDKQRSWEGAAHEYEEQARFARAERDRALSDYLRQHKDACDRYLEVHRLEAERDRLKAALANIGLQRTAKERDLRGEEDGDIDGAYDHVISIARAALSDPSRETKT